MCEDELSIQMGGRRPVVRVRRRRRRQCDAIVASRGPALSLAVSRIVLESVIIVALINLVDHSSY